MPHDIQIKSLLNKTKKRDVWFLDDYTINPYSGCSFNCLFCYIRGSKYGIHMEQKLSVKVNALEVLEKQLRLRAKKNQYGIIVLSSATDPYLQFEKDTQLTREILKLIVKYKFPLHVITRSSLVYRDFDLLDEINSTAILPLDLSNKLKKKVFLTFSFSTSDNEAARIFEPGATPPQERLKTVKEAIDCRLHTGISLMPLLPYISDTGENLNKMFGEFKQAGVNYLMGAGLTLFGSGSSDSKTLVFKAIVKHYPHLLTKYEEFFSNANQMPAYYHQALKQKLKELCETYEIKQGILQSFEE